MEREDITTHEDVSLLIHSFYGKVRADALLSPVFSHVDWDHHTPVIINFWAMLLLGESDYKGNPFQKHINLPIQREHFDRWLFHFRATVDEFFEGEKAAEAKARAVNIANMFQFRLGLTV
jgi:hemoglobin